MSWQAVHWAMRGADVRSTAEVMVLVVLADHADDEGRGAWPSQTRIAQESRASRRTVQKVLTDLQARGVIRRGDQSLAPRGRVGRPVVVWDLVMDCAHQVPDMGSDSAQDMPETPGVSGGIKRNLGPNKAQLTTGLSAPAAHDPPVIHQGSTSACAAAAGGGAVAPAGGGQHTHTPAPSPGAPDPAGGCAAEPESLEAGLVLRETGLDRLPGPIRSRLRAAAGDLLDDGFDRGAVVEALERWRARPGSGIGLLPFLASDVLLERREAELTGREPRDTAAEARRRRLECPHCDECGWLLDPESGLPMEPAVRCSHGEPVVLASATSAMGGAL